MLHGMKLPLSISWTLGKEPITSLFDNCLRAQHLVPGEVTPHAEALGSDGSSIAMIDKMWHTVATPCLGR